MDERPPIGSTVLVGAGPTLYPAVVVSHGVTSPRHIFIRFGQAPIPVRVSLDLVRSADVHTE